MWLTNSRRNKEKDRKTTTYVQHINNGEMATDGVFHMYKYIIRLITIQRRDSILCMERNFFKSQASRVIVFK